MKNYLKYAMLVTLATFCCINAVANDKKVNTKFGKPTMEELEMTVYEPDPEAEALILSKKGEAIFSIDDIYGFKINYKYENRIKILKQEGTGYADIEIPYYYHENSALARDEIISVKAYSFNLENGKVVKTELKKDLIFEERVIDNYFIMKFSIPNVKVGSVIEYKYEIRSTRIPYMRSWYAQAEIPTLYSYFETTIPEYFKFNLSVRGLDAMDIKRTPTTMKMVLSAYGQRTLIDLQADHIEIKAHDVSAMKDDDYIYGVRDYISHVDFEMRSLNFPGEATRHFTSSWENVEEGLFDVGFGDVYTMKNPYPEANEQINAIEGINGKVAAVLSYVNDHIKWNDKYSLVANNDQIAEGIGSSATINSVIMSMLRDAGVQCFAVALRLRSNGALVKFMPTLSDLDTFVVGYVDESGKMHYVDGTDPYNTIDVLPVNMLVENARVIAQGYEGTPWVNLTKLSRNVSQTAISATIDVANSKLNVREQQRLRGQTAAKFRKGYSEKDSADYVKDFATAMDITLNDMSIQQAPVDQPQVITLDYSKNVDMTDSLIYVSPTIVPLLEANPFTAVKREIPVCFPYNTQKSASVSITIPEGYAVDELPESIAMRSENNEMQFVYNLSVSDNTIVVMLKFVQNEVVYPVEKYELLRSFYTQIADKCNEMIVLRKL